MIDKFGRTLTYLRVSLIDRCNLRCLYCMPQGLLNPFKEDDLLIMDETAEIISIARVIFLVFETDLMRRLIVLVDNAIEADLG